MTGNPQRDKINLQLDDIRREQSTLYRAQRSQGLTARDQARRAELDRLEIHLMNELRQVGRRVIGQRHAPRSRRAQT